MHVCDWCGKSHAKRVSMGLYWAILCVLCELRERQEHAD